MAPEFDGGCALAHARALAFPRLTGSEGEPRARERIVHALEAAGWRVREVPFRFYPFVAIAFIKGLIAASLAAFGLLAILAPVRPGTAAVGAAALGVAIALGGRRFTRLASCPDLDPRGSLLARLFPDLAEPWESRNIEAEHPGMQKEGALTWILLAHYDSKSQNLPLVVRIGCAIALVIGGLGLVLRLILGGLWPAAFATTGAAVATGILFGLALLGGLGIVSLSTQNRSPGGIDNAGSVGALLHLAEVLAAHPPADARVRLVFTGAEEFGMVGGYFLGRSLGAGEHRIVNLDGMGTGGRLFATMETGLFTGHRRRYPEPWRRIENAARATGFPVRYFSRLLGGGMDHFPLLWQGIPAISLAEASRKSLVVHTARDTADLLDEAALGRVGRLLVHLVGAG